MARCLCGKPSPLLAPASPQGRDEFRRDVDGRRQSAGARPRVLWLIKGLGLGGAEKLLSMAVPHLDRSRFDYEAGFFLPWKDALVDDLQMQGVPVTCFDIRNCSSFVGFGRLLAHIKQRRIDVIHMHLPVSGVVGRLAGKLMRVPGLIYTEHNVWGRLNPITRLMNRVTFGLNDFSIAVSDDVRLSMTVGARERLTTIANGIACEKMSSVAGDAVAMRRDLGVPEGHLIIGKVANLTPKKNHEMLLKAFALFSRRFPRSTLVLVGQLAGREQHLRNLAAELDIAKRVIFTGPRTDVLRVVQTFDVFALSSTFEGLPIALLEAMSLEKPTVCTAVGGVPGVIRDGREGFLVPAGRVDVMADRFAQLAATPSLRRELGSAARERVRKEFDIATMVRRVEEVYMQVLEEKGVWRSR